MSSPEKRKQDREKGKRKGLADSAKKKLAAKSHTGQGWVVLPGNPNYMVPSGKAEKYPLEIGNILTLGVQSSLGGAIKGDALYAVVSEAENIELSESSIAAKPAPATHQTC